MMKAGDRVELTRSVCSVVPFGQCNHMIAPGEKGTIIGSAESLLVPHVWVRLDHAPLEAISLPVTSLRVPTLMETIATALEWVTR